MTKLQQAVRTSLGVCPVLLEMVKAKRARQKALMGVQSQLSGVNTNNSCGR